MSGTEVTKGGALLRKAQDDSRVIGLLREENLKLTKRIMQLENQLTAEQVARVNEADKWRDRTAALTEELRAVSKGVKTGCACPAGKCMKMIEPGQMCWAQWAGLSAVRSAAQSEIDRMVRASNHPSRYVEKDSG